MKLDSELVALLALFAIAIVGMVAIFHDLNAAGF